MVVANTTMSHSDMPHSNKIIYEEVGGGLRDEDRIYEWEKTQEWRSGKYTLWDHCFELPHKHLEAEAQIVDSVQVGQVNHKLKVNGNDKLEIYDFPGEYAQRFDGVDRGGGDRAADLQKIFEDNRRTTDIRMQQETVPGIVIQGMSNCRQLRDRSQIFAGTTLQRRRPVSAHQRDPHGDAGEWLSTPNRRISAMTIVLPASPLPCPTGPNG